MRALIKKLSIILSVVFCLGYFSTACADEAITNFVSDIYINDNGSADISETITVHAEQKKIINGIVRWMPRFYRDKTDHLTDITYFVTNVLLNGLPTPYHIIKNDKTTAIFIGTPNRKLAPGDYTYLIQYHIDDAVVRGSSSDQFYWNVTGSGEAWPFPINNVDATIHLPQGADVLRYAAYTGTFANQTHDFFVSSPLGSSVIDYTTTRVLAPGEELTVGVSWPLGFIHTPTPPQNVLADFLYNNGRIIALVLMVLLLLYFSLVWNYETRKPDKSDTQIIFQPPESMSPAALRYIQKMTFDNKALTVAIISMAVKGYLVISENEDKNFSLIKKSSDTNILSRAERALAEILFAKSDTIELNVRNHRQILHAQDEMKKNLRDEYEKTYFVTHATFLVPGFVLGFFGILALAFASHDLNDIFYIIVMLMLAVFYLSVQMPKACDAVRDYARSPETEKKLPIIGRLLVTLFLILVIVISIIPIIQAVYVKGIVMITGILFIEVVFYHLLKLHTPKGRKLMDQVTGFKEYLAHSKSEPPSEKLPTKTPGLYEKYLPYAIALDVENRWGEQFTKVLSKTNRHGAYKPVWLVGTSEWHGNLTINSLVTTLGDVWVMLYLSASPRQSLEESEESMS